MANTIQIGNYTFTDSDIMSGNIVMEHSAIGETLSADALTFTVHTTDTGNSGLFTKFLEWYTTVNGEGFVIAGDNIEDITYATPAYYYIDDALRGKFFVSKIKRIGEELYTIECTSAIGLLITSKHLGGIYSNVTASTLIADILDGITYSLDASLADASITGYLPVESKRDALQQVLFAIQGAIKIESDGTLSIVQMLPNPTSTIEADSIYLTNGTVETSQTVDGVQLTEHNYFEGGDNETLYDDSINGVQLITFSDPHYNIAAVNAGGTSILVSSGANYAIVGSTGVAQACTITGNKYIHVERVVSAGNVSVTGEENIVQVPNAYLANPAIADTLADVVWGYAQCNQKIKADIVVGNEKAGDIVSIINPYTLMSTNALVTSMNITMSGTNKATSEFLVGYTPASVVSGFHHYVLLTGEGVWTASNGDITVTPTTGKIIVDGTEYTTAQTLHNPDNPISKIRFILVGGACGGGLGQAGGAGSQAVLVKHTVEGSRDSLRDVVDSYSAGAGGGGGNGGKGGACGRIFELSLNIESGDSGTYESGQGGNAGTAPDDTPLGTESTFTQNTSSFSSASGRYYNSGYYESLSQLTFAGKGADGVSGGAGGNAAPNGTDSGIKGEDVGTYQGGNPTGYVYNQWSTGSGATAGSAGASSYGLGGGGASGLANGGNAVASISQYGTTIAPGNGANGGNAVATTNYGQGGNGGNGGGGGGGGAIYNSFGGNTYYYREYWYETSVGTGGTGGNGAAGYQGCVLFYF